MYMSADELAAFNGLNAVKKLANETAVASGWYTDLRTGQLVDRNVGEVIALMHSELSEALEGWRKRLMDEHLPTRSSMEVEFADCIIRIADTAAAMGLDIAGAFVEKNRFNKTRADHKLSERNKEHGKRI